MFCEIAPKIKSKNIEPLGDAFKRKTGITIAEYFLFAHLILAATEKDAIFDACFFLDSEVSHLKYLLTKEKIHNFLGILKADYKTFRDVDEKTNQRHDPLFTKTRFNPLWIYPIIEFDNKGAGSSLVIPNFVAYIKKAFGDFYWWFHLYYEGLNQQLAFHEYFGEVYQHYVGLLLEQAYPKKVRPEFVYAKTKRFTDWWVEEGEKIYLFEVKASQFSLLSKQTGDADHIASNEIKKVADGIEQLFKRVEDVNNHSELSQFKNKKLVPVLVFFDFPFASGNLYDAQVKKELLIREKEKGLNGLSEFTTCKMSVEELEAYAPVSSQISIDDVFSSYKDDPRSSFLSTIASKCKNTENSYLRGKCNELWDIITEGKHRKAESD